MELFCCGIAITRICVSVKKFSKKVSSKVEIYTSDFDAEKGGHLRALAKDVIAQVPYHPSPYSYFDHHGQMQTAGQYFLRNFSRVLLHLVPSSHLFVSFDREIIELSDGGIVAIDWASLPGAQQYAPNPSNNQPIMILHHGLVGDSQSEYIYHFIRQLIRNGYKVGVMIARGCGGLPLKTVFTFAGRKTGDMRAVVLKVKASFPQFKLFWMGYSLGAAATLQYLEDFHGQSDDDRSHLDAVMCVSPPWSFWVKKRNHLDIWSILMVLPLKMYLLRHSHVLNKFPDNRVSLLRFLTIRDIIELNEECFRGFGGLTKDGNSYLVEKATENNMLDQLVAEEESFVANTNKLIAENEQNPVVSLKHLPKDIELAAVEKNAQGPIEAASVTSVTHSASSFNEDEQQQQPAPPSVTEAVSKTDTHNNNRDLHMELLQKHGTLQYRSVDEYYDDCSPVFRAHLITTPTLSISAKDDPICAHKDCPKRGRDIGPGLVVVKTKVGGHLAFPEGLVPLTHAWTDRVALAWFDKFL